MPLATKAHTKTPIAFNGSASVAAYEYTFAAATAGTLVELEQLPAGAQLQKIEVINDALGAGVTLSIGEMFDNVSDGTTSATSLKAATAAATAGAFAAGFHPKLLNTKRTITLTTGGAAATGKISVLVQYVFIGNGQ